MTMATGALFLKIPFSPSRAKPFVPYNKIHGLIRYYKTQQHYIHMHIYIHNYSLHTFVNLGLGHVLIARLASWKIDIVGIGRWHLVFQTSSADKTFRPIYPHGYIKSNCAYTCIWYDKIREKNTITSAQNDVHTFVNLCLGHVFVNYPLGFLKERHRR